MAKSFFVVFEELDDFQQQALLKALYQWRPTSVCHKNFAMVRNKSVAAILRSSSESDSKF